MLAVIQKEKSFNEIFSDYFKENKTEIAHAIPKLFPFLESLKDHSFITDKIYADSYEACRNLVPVENVVYNVLDHLEKFSGWSFLCILFNRTNLNAYPGLREIHKSLETELQDKYLSQRRKQDQKLATKQPRYEQGAGDGCSQRRLTRTPSDPSSSDGAIQSGSRKRLSESAWDARSKHTNTDHSVFHPRESHQTNCEPAQAGTNLHTHENWTGPCFVKQENLQKPGTMQNQEDEVIVIGSEGSECSDEDDEKELLELFTVTPGVRRQIEEESEDHVPQAPELRTSLRNSHLLFPDSPPLGDIEEPSRPFSAPYFF
ncbi:nuclear autoantigen Sp-100-like [Onychomys torridus]|uniref:nuclear autoantigen Sp-100-like n=1 Tax=Onychomys torridus TaxID=38674 RepID=UPI00167F4985|nr:nuclear autoantigen Sp-100-like [Onychomys torridus]